ncbi:MAG: nucleotidyltransferase domain-containing protein [Candidatus Methanoplasma sp.]|jgi:predicted nucleotidyltransferase|nr:nucleotidyltransferase domain-containing protein [Candidatus Methanoplasma sp.]
MADGDKGHNLTFEELCGIVTPIVSKHRVIRMYLFGSRARGDNRDDSDFDFCIVVPEDCDLMDIGSLLNHLRDALGTEVDLVCENSLQRRLSLVEEVMHDRRIVFEARY